MSGFQPYENMYVVICATHRICDALHTSNDTAEIGMQIVRTSGEIDASRFFVLNTI